jgi:hypothetical protein
MAIERNSPVWPLIPALATVMRKLAADLVDLRRLGESVCSRTPPSEAISAARRLPRSLLRCVQQALSRQGGFADQVARHECKIATGVIPLVGALL